MTQTDSPPDPAARYEGANSGRVLTYRQIGYIGWKTATTVERVGDGFVVDGDLFTPLEDDDGG